MVGTRAAFAGVIAGFVAFALHGSARAARVIDFETYPNGSPVAPGSQVTNEFSPWGVTFDSVRAAGAAQVTTVIAHVPATSGANSLGPGGPPSNVGGTLILSFNPAVVSVGSSVIDDQFAVQITARDAAGNVVGSTASTASAAGGAPDYWSLAHAGGIARVEMSGGFFPGGAPDGWAIDDLTFGQVPEPAAGLGLVGALALTLARRRRASPAPPAP
jgi:hypothetical protein